MTPTGGSHGKPHRTTEILSHARRRGRVAARGARAAAGEANNRISQRLVAEIAFQPNRRFPTMAERKLVSSITAVEQTSGGRLMGQTRRHTALGIMAVTAGIAVLGGEIAWPAEGLEARVVAINIPSASAIAQVGTF